MATATPMKVVGLGDPVTDYAMEVSHEFLERIGAKPGGCMLVSPHEMVALIEAATASSSTKPTRVPGGSAANVVTGLAACADGALAPHFMGMVGADEAGAFYHEQLLENGVEPLLLESSSGTPSARCVCFITPDGQRTMRTCLGAAAELTDAGQLPLGWEAGAALLHCEGYALYRPQLARTAMAAAKGAGALVSLDLASFEVVAACRPALMGLLQAGLVDVVFANEEEAAALAGGTASGQGRDTAALVGAAQELLLRHTRACVVSLGSRGAVARGASGESGFAPALRVPVVDTIGAGDLFSSGFLAAYLRGCPLSACCAAGCAAGAEAVQARGAALSDAARRRLRGAVAGVVATAAPGSAKDDGARALACPAPRGKRAGAVAAGSIGRSPGMERIRSVAASVASSMVSSSSMQWLAMDADA